MKINAKQPTGAQVAAQNAEATRGRSIIERLRANRETLIEAREVCGETVYIKRLNWTEITRIRLAIPRDKAKVLNLQDEDHLRAVTIGMIATAVVVGKKEGEEGDEDAELDDTPLFTLAEAVELVDEPNALQYVGELFHVVSQVNPNVLPNSKAAPSNQ